MGSAKEGLHRLNKFQPMQSLPYFNSDSDCLDIFQKKFFKLLRTFAVSEL